MRILFWVLFLMLYCNCTAQDNIRVSGYGSMVDLPHFSTDNKFHWEFSHFSKNTIVEIILWDFNASLSDVNKTVIFRELLSMKENSRVDVMIQNDKKGNVEICCNLFGEFFSMNSLKSDVPLTPYIIKSQPKIQGKVIPIVLFIGKDNTIDKCILEKIINLQEFDLEKDKRSFEELLHQFSSFKMLTYKLMEDEN